jgi:ABC-type cobalamin/Fe3+-siderophores transport system ATPase subunit
MGGHEDVAYGSAAELLTEETLSRLYDIDVRIVTYRADDGERQAVVTGYGSGELDRR